MKTLKYLFLIVDIGFLLYWLVTLFKWIPPEYLYSDYNNPLMVDWNWSFLPLDLCISATGLTSVYLYHKNRGAWKKWALVSLVLTFTSGLQALAFGPFGATTILLGGPSMVFYWYTPCFTSPVF